MLSFCSLLCVFGQVGANAFAKTSLGIFVIVIVSVIAVIMNFFLAKENLDIACPTEFSNCTSYHRGSHDDTTLAPAGTAQYGPLGYGNITTPIPTNLATNLMYGAFVNNDNI